MIRHGLLCRNCTSKGCKDLSTESEPVDVQCPECEGDGCSECNNGLVRLTGCPQRYCDEIACTVRLADLFDKGMPPIAGGALDQSAWFIDAVSYFRHEESMVKAEAHGE